MVKRFKVRENCLQILKFTVNNQVKLYIMKNGASIMLAFLQNFEKIRL